MLTASIDGRGGTGMGMRRTLALAAGIASAVPTLAAAHTGLGGSQDVAHGFAHPLGGIDHLLAMTMVGVLAFRMGGRAIWLVPSTFVVVMVVGGLLGMMQVDIPLTEIGIAISVVVLGATVAAGLKPPLTAVLVAVASFAVFHGYAHGAEMPEDAGGIGFGFGFVLATAMLHAFGIGVGYGLARLNGRRGDYVLRGVGAAVAVAGTGLLVGAM